MVDGKERPIFKASFETQIIIDRLSTKEVGEVVKYEELEALAGSNIEDLRGSISTARRCLMRDQNMVFGTLRGVGLKRLDHNDTVGFAEDFSKRSRRANTQALKALNTIEFEGLSEERKGEYTALTTVARIVDLSLRNRSKKKVRELISGSRPTPEIGAAVQHLFASTKRKESLGDEGVNAQSQAPSEEPDA